MPVTLTQVEALIAKLEPSLRKAFNDAVQNWRQNVDLNALAQALANGDIEAALRAANIQPAALNSLISQTQQAFDLAGTAELTGLKFNIIFNIRDLRAEQQLRDAAATLVKGATQDQVAMLRTVLTDALSQGQGARVTALDIVGRLTNGQRVGGYIGLTQTQAQWVLNYRNELQSLSSGVFDRLARDKRFDGTVRKAIANNEPLSDAQIATMTTAYKNRLLKLRGEAIARTETIRAVNAGRMEAFQQAVDSGKVAQQNVRRVWNTTMDGRERDTHAALNKQSVGLNESFVSPSGARLRYPGDPIAPLSETANCRCNVSYRVDHLANVH